MHTVLGSFLHLNFLPLSSRVFQFIFFSFSQFLSKNEGCGEKTRNIDSFRVIYQIVLFFNRLFHVIFRVTFFINLSKEEISKKWNEIFQMLNRARNKIDVLSWKRYRNGFSIIRSCPGIINLTKHHAKLCPFPSRAVYHFAVSFLSPTRNLHSTVPSFFEFLFATNGPPDLFEILIDPFVRSKMSVVALI